MKKIKRFFAVLLAMVMVLGMGVTAFAAESTAKIVVSDVPEGARVTYEKIAEAAPTDPIGWSPVKKYDAVQEKDVDLISEEILNAWAKESAYDNDRENTNAEEGKIASNAGIVTAIKDITLTQSANDWTMTNSEKELGQTTIHGVEAGLYVIEVQKEGYTFSRMMAYVGYDADMNVVAETPVTAKGEKDQVKKDIVKVTANGTDTDIDTSVTEGDTVEFKVTANYPYLDQTLTNKKFVVTDSVQGGTIDKSSIVVKIGGNNAAAADYTLTPDSITNTFTVTFKYDAAKAGSVVEITYNVNVDESASLQNKVESIISKYPEGNEPEGETKTEYVVNVPKVSASVKKTDENGAIALANAEFTLYIEADEADADASRVVVLETEGATTGTIKDKTEYDPTKDGTVVKYVKVVDTQITSSDTDKMGIAEFTGLDAQKPYWVAETKAPTGYSLNTTAKKLEGAEIGTNPKEETVTADGVTRVTKTYEKLHDFNQITISDTKLSALPSTGGIGTTIFTLGGCAIMIAAAGLFFASRRKTVK